MEEVPRRTSLVPLAFLCFLHCLIGVETEGLLDYQGRAGDHFHCTVEPSPGHIRCRQISLPKIKKKVTDELLQERRENLGIPARGFLSWAKGSFALPFGILRDVPPIARGDWGNLKQPPISSTHPSRDVVFSGQVLAKKCQKLLLYMTCRNL